MRLIFLVLVLVNLAYLGWQYYDPIRPIAPKSPVVAHRAGNGVPIVLLQEQDQVGDAAIATIPIVQNPQDMDKEKNCSAIGPFGDVASGQDVQARLYAIELRAEVLSVDRFSGEFDYRVLIPPMSSLQQAFRHLRELKARDIDSYVITAGEHALGISLGVFSEENPANVVKDRFAQLGYEVNVVEIPRIRREYWVFPENVDQMLDDELFDRLVDGQSGITQARLVCER